LTRLSYITVNGARLFYSVAGKGQPPIVLVPGWCCDHSAMVPLAKHLQPSYRVIAVDMRGLGRSELPAGPLTMTELVEDLRSLCEQLDLVKPILVGHSLGGRVVLAMLKAHPDLARGAVLLDVAIDESPAYVMTRRIEVEGYDWDDALRQRFEKLLSSESAQFTAELVARMVSTPIDTARAYLRAADDFDMVAALAECTLPVLYVGASSPRESQRTLLELKPDLIYGQAVGSGHFVQLDAPAQVAAMIDRFVMVKAGERPG
jgi:pimeloyl-ACP methyl ester carboxylesterase